MQRNEKSEKQVADAASARVMTQLLKEVVESGTGSKITLKDIYDTAGKTGTSGNDRDRVFVGYTPYYIAGIWCGYTDRSESVGNHERNHLTVWDDVMRLIHEKTLSYSESCESFSVQELIYASFCKDSGKSFSEACSYDVRGDRIGWGYFIKGTEPGESCDRHVVLYENIFPFISKISLIRVEERTFPKEINVTDEKYVYRDKKTRQR